MTRISTLTRTGTPNKPPTTKTAVGTAPERPDYEATARTLRALAVKARESLKATGRLATRKTPNPEGKL